MGDDGYPYVRVGLHVTVDYDRVGGAIRAVYINDLRAILLNLVKSVKLGIITVNGEICSNTQHIKIKLFKNMLW